LNRDTVRARHALYFIEQLEPDQALALLADHTFKPWEGGAVVHNMFVRAIMEKGKAALAEHKPQEAALAFRQAMRYPEELGTGEPAQPELSEQFYWLGVALAADGNAKEAADAWQSAIARAAGRDNVFSALAHRKLGQEDLAQQMLARCAEIPKRSDAEAESLAHDALIAGLAERYRGDKARAQENFHHALALDPSFWEARVAMAEKNISH
jgi:tetratricopeptide (TPR) repeat protein